MKILVTGANGFVGSYLMPKLAQDGHVLCALVHRHTSSIAEYVTKLTLDDLKASNETFDAIINLAGANIGAKRWTKDRKNLLRTSRIDFTKRLIEALPNIPSIWLNASAVGYYGNDDHKAFTEDTPANTGFTHTLCEDWENVALSANADRTVIFRLGVVLGKGGVLDKMLLPYKLGLGSKIGSGRQFFPWIHVNDVCSFIQSALGDDSFHGTYNLVSPDVTDQAYFSKSLAQALNRPHVLWTPACALEMALGEMGTLITKGQKVIPQRLTARHFQFQYPELNHALNAVLAPD